MFLSDSLIYLELQKTGCTHIGRLLAQVLPGKQIGKHNQLPLHLADDLRPIIGSIRNPWDWYISLWAYGCDRKGALYNRVTSTKSWWYDLVTFPRYAIRSIPIQLKKPRQVWRNSYRSVDDPAAFREWLYLLCDYERQREMAEGYDRTPISKFAGLMTFRYLTLFERDPFYIFTKPESFTSIADISAFDREKNLLTGTIRNEQLEDDVIKVLGQCGVQLSDEQIALVRNSKKTNTSSRKRSVEYYYDRDTLELVKRREQFIIEKYGYPTPSLQPSDSALQAA